MMLRRVKTRIMMMEEVLEREEKESGEKGKEEGVLKGKGVKFIVENAED